ncbi:MAG: S-methyl-5'-thioadenosine phosphorylase [Actinomycetota bacterium]
MAQAQIGILGGSGFYSLLDRCEEVQIETPFGPPSDLIALGTIAGREVAFMPRHGRAHSLPPHMINYRANLFAFRELGVTRVLAPCAAGSLNKQVHPGDFVVCDQFVDRTRNRKDTFFDGPNTTHVSLADPYCPQLRSAAAECGRAMGLTIHSTGTMLVIEGPRFSTRAESAFHSAQGWTAVSMTQYPEVALARELQMCFTGVALITDYDAGVTGAEAVSAAKVIEVFKQSNERLKELLHRLVQTLPEQRSCPCGRALEGASL